MHDHWQAAGGLCIVATRICRGESLRDVARESGREDESGDDLPVGS